MSKKNHIQTGDRLLQSDKKYAHLKLKQKEKIAAWMYDETRKYCSQFDKVPENLKTDEIISHVYDRIEAEGIWIPYKEVVKHYRGKQTQILKRIRRENKAEFNSLRIQKVNFMNMCMICDGKGNVVALDKVGDSYCGTTFPGGHVEPGESFVDSVIREVKEETGLIIEKPKLKGIYHWFRENIHNIGYLYRVDYCEGGLRSSGEGEVYWISLEEYVQKELAGGMDKVLTIMTEDDFSECYCIDGEEILQ